MLALQRKCSLLILAAAPLLLGTLVSFCRAQESVEEQQKNQVPLFKKLPAGKEAALKKVTAPPVDEPDVPKKDKRQTARKDADSKPDEKQKEAADTKKSAKETAKAPTEAAKKQFDPALVSAGSAAFERSCTTCHDAARSLERTKDLPGWRATVKRMAAKRGADVAAGDIEPIAVFLASRSAGGAESAATADASAKVGNGDGSSPKAVAAGDDVSPISTFATLSPQWRGGNDRLQNPGFGPLAWVGASWQSKFVSARATLCISCHGVQEQAFLSRVELVEAAARIDLSEFLGSCCRGVKGGIDAGRFIVPFGAFAAQTNPGLYRTVSTPLIFNMGQRVFNRDLGDPVLPMPYSDTGVNFNFDVPLCDVGTGPITASIDSFLVNGLVGNSSGIDFLQSRNLLDNNNQAAVGGRLTIGDPYLRAGASYLSGRFEDPNDPAIPNPLHYTIFGFDLQARYKKLFRFQTEYAQRDTDRIGAFPVGLRQLTERIDGYYLEAEVRPWEECRVSFLARHDLMRRASPLPPPTSALPTGAFTLQRVTVGLNIELWHQSLLMFNIERWIVPETEHAINVYGVRYTVTF